MKRIPGLEHLLAVAAFAFYAARALAGQIVVFEDGRIMRVVDAKAEGRRMHIKLGNGGEIWVPLTRVQAVVSSDEEEQRSPLQEQDRFCDPSWRREPLPDGTPFAKEIEKAAKRANLHPWLLAALVQAESRFDPQALSRAGAMGLCQLMPSVAEEQGVKDAWNPSENLKGGASYLRSLIDLFGDVELALAAYNAGPVTVKKHGGIPPYRETRTFIRRVMAVFCPPHDGAHDPHNTRHDGANGGKKDD